MKKNEFPINLFDKSCKKVDGLIMAVTFKGSVAGPEFFCAKSDEILALDHSVSLAFYEHII